jgi:hypothetical protein
MDSTPAKDSVRPMPDRLTVILPPVLTDEKKAQKLLDSCTASATSPAKSRWLNDCCKIDGSGWGDGADYGDGDGDGWGRGYGGVEGDGESETRV